MGRLILEKQMPKGRLRANERTSTSRIVLDENWARLARDCYSAAGMGYYGSLGALVRAVAHLSTALFPAGPEWYSVRPTGTEPELNKGQERPLQMRCLVRFVGAIEIMGTTGRGEGDRQRSVVKTMETHANRIWFNLYNIGEPLGSLSAH